MVLFYEVFTKSSFSISAMRPQKKFKKIGIDSDQRQTQAKNSRGPYLDACAQEETQTRDFRELGLSLRFELEPCPPGIREI
jgi:hypothetical protein